MALIAYYKLNDNAVDDSGSGYDGTETNMSYTTGKVGNAGIFHDETDYITIADAAPLRLTSGGTIAVWIYAYDYGALTAFGRILDKSTTTGGANGYNFAFDTGGLLSFRVNAGGVTSIAAADVPLNNWLHITVVFDGTGRKMYVNGVDKTSAGGAVTTLPPNVAGTTRIGQRANTADRGFDGLIDELRIYDSVLSDAEVLALYNSYIVPRFQINIGDSWKAVAGVQINIGDTWKAVPSAQINIGDAWKPI